MSRENVEILRRGYASWRAGGVEAVLHLMDERIEWIQDPDFPGAKAYRGHDGVRQWDAWLDESWETKDVEVEQLLDCGDDVLALLRLRVRGRGSGLDIEVALAHLWTIRNGRLVRLQFYLDPAKALEAVGLRE